MIISLYIFGLEDRENWRQTDRKNAIAIPEFFNKSHSADKYVIVGHWPVVNYSDEAPSNNPVIDKEKKLLRLMVVMRLKKQGN